METGGQDAGEGCGGRLSEDADGKRKDVGDDDVDGQTRFSW